MRLEDAKKSYRQVQILISDGSGGAPETRAPRSKFFHYHAVIIGWRTPSGVGAPCRKSWIRHCY